jgi:hypothetical protein
VNLDRTNRWLTPLANIAILAGIVLVAYELNQNAALTRTSLVNEGNLVQNQLWADIMGEAPTEVLARAVECPEEMTYADAMVMDAYLFTSMNMLYRDYQLAQEGIFTDADWRRAVENYAGWYLGNEYGLAWWDEVAKNFFSGEFVSHVEAQFDSIQGKDSYSYWLKLRSRLLGPALGPAGRPSCEEI